MSARWIDCTKCGTEWEARPDDSPDDFVCDYSLNDISYPREDAASREVSCNVTEGHPSMQEQARVGSFEIIKHKTSEPTMEELIAMSKRTISSLEKGRIWIGHVNITRNSDGCYELQSDTNQHEALARYASMLISIMEHDCPDCDEMEITDLEVAYFDSDGVQQYM